MKHYKFIIISCIVFGFSNAKAQKVMTLENAVKTALENNYEIKIASNNSLISKTNVAIGNAGMLPTLAASVTANNRVQNSSQTLQSGVVNSLDNAKNNSLNYGVNLDWTVFDGFKMFAKLDQLKELQKLGEAQLKQTILTKISAVTNTYFDLVQPL
jgi:outer membrane protein TolC